MISHFDCEFCYDFTVSVSAETFEIGRTETEPKYRPNFCFGRTLLDSCHARTTFNVFAMVHYLLQSRVFRHFCSALYFALFIYMI